VHTAQLSCSLLFASTSCFSFTYSMVTVYAKLRFLFPVVRVVGGIDVCVHVYIMIIVADM